MFDTEIHTVLSDGETYTLAQLTLRDWSAFSEWVGEREGKKIVAFDEMIKAAETMSGLVWIVHRSFSTHHGGISRDRVMALVGSLDRLAEIGEKVMAQPAAGQDENPRNAEEAKT